MAASALVLDVIPNEASLLALPFFGDERAIKITSQLVTRYIDPRQQEGAENATINREWERQKTRKAAK